MSGIVNTVNSFGSIARWDTSYLVYAINDQYDWLYKKENMKSS